MENLKLFVWEHVLCDWTCGMVCVLAHDLTEARSIVRKKDEGVFREIGGLKPKVVTEPAAFYSQGGS